MKKRLLALLLCLVMVIGLVPVALADGGRTPESEITYTIKVDANSGVLGSNGNFTLPKGSKIPKPVAYKYGYYVSNWTWNYEGEADQGNWNFDWTLDKNGGTVELHAVWAESTYSIAFNANGGKGTMNTISNIKIADGTTLPTKTTLTANIFKRDGYTFKGWSTSSTGIVEYADSAEVCFATAENGDTITLYAVWEKNNAEPEAPVKLTYNKADGTSTVKEETSQNGTFTLKDYSTLGWTVPNGKKFVYWADKDGNLYTVGTVIRLEKDLELSPVWEKTAYDVTFYCYNHGRNDTITVPANTKLIIDPNYGTYAGSKATQTIYVTADRSIADASRTGYYFYGWYVTELNGVYTFTAIWDRGYYSTYSIYYYDFEDCKSEYANFPYGTSIVIDPNGGTAKLSGTSFSTKQYFNIYRDYTLTDASRSGYTFYGWDLTKSGSTYYFTAMWSRYKSDVPYMLNGTDHYAYIKGYPNGSFKPTDTITRAEAATIFYRLLTDSTRKAYATTYNSFKDVPATAWYNTAVSTMAKLGIVNGGADGYFRPNDPITRAEIAAMIARCDGAYYTGTSTVFSDTYGHWAAGYIDRAYELGWINGYGTTYAPDRYISRAETVAVLNRVLNRAPQYTSDLTRNYTTFSDVATSAWYYLDVEEAANSHTYTRKSNADYETWTKLIADPSWF